MVRVRHGYYIEEHLRVSNRNLFKKVDLDGITPLTSEQYQSTVLRGLYDK